MLPRAESPRHLDRGAVAGLPLPSYGPNPAPIAWSTILGGATSTGQPLDGAAKSVRDSLMQMSPGRSVSILQTDPWALSPWQTMGRQ